MRGGDIWRALKRASDGDLTVFGGPAVSPGQAGRVRAAQIDVVHRYTPWMMLGCMVNAFVLAAALLNTRYHMVALGWAALVCPAAATIYFRWWQGRHSPARASVSHRAIHRVISNAAIYGLAWGLTPLLFFGGESQPTDLIIVCLCAGMMCGAAVALSTVPVAAIVATACISLGAAIAFLSAGDSLHVMAALLLLTYTAVLVKSSISHASVLTARVLEQIKGEQQRDVIGMLLCEFEENASDWLWEIDAEHNMAHVSARLAALVRKDAADLLGRPFSEVIAPAADAFDNMKSTTRAELFARLGEGASFRNLEVPVFVNGAQRTWLLTGRPVRAPDGAVEGYRGVGADITEARAAEVKIRHLARHDALTGLPNRVVFREEMDLAIARLKRSNEPFAVHCVDLDHLKEVNDTLGHAGGDALLAEVANRLAGLITDKDVFARVGVLVLDDVWHCGIDGAAGADPTSEDEFRDARLAHRDRLNSPFSAAASLSYTS